MPKLTTPSIKYGKAYDEGKDDEAVGWGGTLQNYSISSLHTTKVMNR